MGSAPYSASAITSSAKWELPPGLALASATCTAMRAGGFSGQYSIHTAWNALRYFRSVRYSVTFTTCCSVMPAPSHSTFRFSKHWRACSAVSSLLLLVTGLRPRIAEKKMKPPAFTPDTMPSMRSGPPSGVGIDSRFMVPPIALLLAGALGGAGEAQVPHQHWVE